MHAQPGIFALGTAEHCFVELDLGEGQAPAATVAALADVAVDLSTTGGVNVTIGVRASIWASTAPPEHVPADMRDWTDDLVGPDGFTMPATPHDAWLWVAGGDRTAVFDSTRHALDGLGRGIRATSEITGWMYRHDRDLTGFVDGTENPSLSEAPQLVLVPPGLPGEGGSVLLLQKWAHDSAAWTSLSTEAQERVIGRTKRDSVELTDRPEASHVARTDQEEFGDIFRRNTPYGSAREHGTVFVGFSATQRPLAAMLESMAGTAGVRDDLTRYTTPLTGSYYFVPSIDDLAALGSRGPE